MILLGSDKSTNPLVAILMGSTSDADTMEPARQMLKLSIRESKGKKLKKLKYSARIRIGWSHKILLIM